MIAPVVAIGSLRRFALNLSLYAGVRLADRAVGFLLIPVVAAYIGGAAAYGVKEYVEVLVALSSLVVGAQIYPAVVRHLNADLGFADRTGVIGTALTFVLCGGGLLAAIMIVFAEPIAEALLHDRAHADAIACAGAIVFFSGLSSLGFSVLEADRRARAYAGLALLKLSTEVGVKLTLLIPFGLGYMAVLYAALVGHAVFGVVVTALALRERWPAPSLAVLRSLLAYALPMVPASLCMLGVHQIDRMLIAEMAGLEQTGVYGIGWKFGAVVSAVLLSAFGTAWFPAVFAIVDRERRRSFVGATSSLFLIVAGAATLVVMALAEAVTALLPPEYADAARLIQVIAFGHMFWFLYQVLSIPIFTAMRTRVLFAVALFGLALNVALNLWAIPLYGALGAAYATALTYAALSLVIDQVARRIDSDAGTERWRLLGVIAWTLACFVIWSVVRPAEADLLADLVGAFVVLALFAAGLVPLRLLGWNTVEELLLWRLKRAESSPTTGTPSPPP